MIDKFSRFIVKMRIPIIILALVSLIPSAFGYFNTNINYDMLTYLPDSLETIQGQDILLDEFGKGAFSLVVVEGYENKDAANLKESIEKVDGVADVFWYTSALDLSVPMDILPDNVYDAFNSDDATLMVIVFSGSTSSDETLAALTEIKTLCNESVYLAGMTSMVEDLKELSEEQEFYYVAIAVALCIIVMCLFLDSWLLPFIFIASIGIAILWNLGTNVFLGEISFITKALAAVLQLAVTMDYSIFLWHSFAEQREIYDNNNEAMAHAISQTLVSVVGSSTTTVAGFIALCFMTYQLGMDLGIVMAKGVVLGVIGAVTVLPAFILVFYPRIIRWKHKALMPNLKPLTDWVVDHSKIFLVIFLIGLVPAWYGYRHTSVYYNIGESLPDYMAYPQAVEKLQENFDINNIEIIMADANLSHKDAKGMIDEINDLDGISFCLGKDSLVGSAIPDGFVPDEYLEDLVSDDYQLIIIASDYATASDEANNQIDAINTIVDKYDSDALFVGEAPCTKDLITTTDRDFTVTTWISIAFTFVIIALVLKSFSFPFVLIAAIEYCIFVNLGIPYYTGSVLSFITPICISTIQLGACVDYAILTTTRYKQERANGYSKKEAMKIALPICMQSVIVSALGFFAATLGVYFYCDVDMISSICLLLSRGAIISMLGVLFILPSLVLILDPIITRTTFGIKKKEA